MKILVALLIVLAGYYFFFHGSAFEKDFYFNGEAYSHIKKARGGEITNHFYTPSGIEFNNAQKFIQIIEISDEMQKINWLDQVQALLNRYKLTPLEGQPLELAGNITVSGQLLNSYATAISVKGKDHMVFYIVTQDKEHSQETTAEKIAIINDLKSIASSFN